LLPCFYYVRDTCVVGSSKGGRFLQNWGFCPHFGDVTINFNAMTLFICFPKPKNRKFHAVLLLEDAYNWKTIKGPLLQWHWSILFQEEGYLQFVLWLLHPGSNFESWNEILHDLQLPARWDKSQSTFESWNAILRDL
jgi:hypothetical protein